MTQSNKFNKVTEKQIKTDIFLRHKTQNKTFTCRDIPVWHIYDPQRWSKRRPIEDPVALERFQTETNIKNGKLWPKSLNLKYFLGQIIRQDPQEFCYSHIELGKSINHSYKAVKLATYAKHIVFWMRRRSYLHGITHNALRSASRAKNCDAA